MILDLDGGPAHTATPRWTVVVLPIIVAALLAAFVAVAAQPSEHRRAAGPARPAQGPSVLADLPPARKINLTFPSDVAVQTSRITVSGITGVSHSEGLITTYRVRATGDVVFLAPLADALALSPNGETFAFRGVTAVSGFDQRSQTNVLRWTEHGITYQLASRTLKAADLARLATQLR